MSSETPSSGPAAGGVRPGAGTVLRRAVRRGPERGALTALFCFRTAEMATWVALLVWAFDRRGAGGTGAVALAQLVPATIVAPFGSVMGDRMPHRRALIIGFLLQAVACVVTALALASDASFVVVCVAAAALSCAIALSRPVYYATLPEIADGPEELTALNSASVGIEGAADFLGPMIAAVLLTVSAADVVLLLMAGVCAVAAVASLAIPPHPRAYAATDDDAYLELLRSGVATLVHDRGAALLTALVGVQYVVIGMLDILGVVLAFDVIGSGPSGPGLLTAALGLGAVLGAAATVVLIGRRRLAPAILVGAAVTGLPIVAASASTAVGQAVLLFGLAGAGTAFLGVAARTLTQRVVAGEVLARVFGLQEALLLGGMAVGTALATGLVAWLGPRGAFVAAGLFLPVAALAVWPWIRGLDHRAVLPGATFALLRGVPMFAVLPQARLERLARELRPVQVAAGSSVVREGERGDRFYVISEGTARVTVDGDERRVLGPGAGFGEIALLHDVPRTATVSAATPLVLAALDRATFLSVVTGTPVSHAAARRVASDLLDPEDR